MHRIAHIHSHINPSSPLPSPTLLSLSIPSISVFGCLFSSLSLSFFLFPLSSYRLPILALPSTSPYPTSRRRDVLPCPLYFSPFPSLGFFLSFLSLDQDPAYYVTLLPRATIFNPETRSNCEFSPRTPSPSRLRFVFPSLPPFPPVSPFPFGKR